MYKKNKQTTVEISMKEKKMIIFSDVVPWKVIRIKYLHDWTMLMHLEEIFYCLTFLMF